MYIYICRERERKRERERDRERDRERNRQTKRQTDTKIEKQGQKKILQTLSTCQEEEEKKSIRNSYQTKK